MAQFNWSYRNANGQQYIIGLYHGTESGHLVVYCNNEIVAIDFNVLDSASFPFFIEEDLCEIRIKREGNTFHYSLESNREVDTPFNRERRRRHKKYRLQLILFVGGVLICSAVFSFFALRGEKRSRQKAQIELLNNYGVEATGRVFFTAGNRGNTEAFYSYAGGGQIREVKIEMPPGRILPNGMLLEEGDEFEVRYHPTRPDVSVMDFNKPAPEQVERYRIRALQEHMRLHPELDEAYAACLLRIAFELKQVAGYADFFWQAADPDLHPGHNRNTYLRLVRDVPFARAAKERCR